MFSQKIITDTSVHRLQPPRDVPLRFIYTIAAHIFTIDISDFFSSLHAHIIYNIYYIYIYIEIEIQNCEGRYCRLPCSVIIT